MVNPESAFQASVEAAGKMEKAYRDAIALLGLSDFLEASAALRSLIKKTAIERGVSLVTAAGVVGNNLKSIGKLNSSTALMLRSSVFALYLAGEHEGLDENLDLLRKVSSQN